MVDNLSDWPRVVGFMQQVESRLFNLVYAQKIGA